MNTNDKTLADAQPGGRVRLGDQAERARFEAWAVSRGWSIQRWADGLRRYSSCDTEKMWEAFQAALSAQPSPGGQGDSRSEKAATFLRQYLTYLRSSPRQGLRPRWCDVYEALEVAIEALAARQPVGNGASGDPLRAALKWYAEQVSLCRMIGSIGDPGRHALDRDGGERALAALALPDQTEQLDRDLGETIDQRDRYHEMADDLAEHIAAITGVDIGEHSSANCPWQNAIDAAEEYKPAQAVDLGRWSQRHAEDLKQAIHTALSAHAGSLSQKKRDAISDYVKRLLIDSQAVGNGR